MLSATCLLATFLTLRWLCGCMLLCAESILSGLVTRSLEDELFHEMSSRAPEVERTPAYLGEGGAWYHERYAAGFKVCVSVRQVSGLGKAVQFSNKLRGRVQRLHPGLPGAP